MIKTFLLFSVFSISISVYSQIGVSQFTNPSGKYSTNSSGLCVCSFSNVSNVADNDLSNYASINIAASAFGATRSIRTKLSSVVSGNTKAGFYINVGAVIPLLPSVSINTYKAGVFQETIVSNADVVSMIGGGLGNVCGTTSNLKSYDELEISFNMGTLTATASIQVFYAYGGYSSCPVFALPVKIIDINAAHDADNAIITWEAVDEGNVQYDLQRSNDGNLFTTIHSETSTSQSGRRKFQFTDSASTNIVYYRVRVVDDNMKQSFFSKTVSLKSSAESSKSIHIFPNPVPGNEFGISFNSIAGKRYHLEVIDNTGHLIYSKFFTANNNEYSDKIYLINTLSVGIYSLKVEGIDTFGQPLYTKLVLAR